MALKGKYLRHIGMFRTQKCRAEQEDWQVACQELTQGSVMYITRWTLPSNKTSSLRPTEPHKKWRLNIS
jgi:hypothetical protein